MKEFDTEIPDEEAEKITNGEYPPKVKTSTQD